MNAAVFYVTSLVYMNQGRFNTNICPYRRMSWARSVREIAAANKPTCLLASKQKGTMASMGLEPMTFALLARRSNQLS